ncbi:MAG: HEPN domain-containing protein [bacterium]
MKIQAWIEKSQENLTVAEWCFENGHFNACANRMYYAMFQAGFAALLKFGISPPKGKIGHDWLQANFSQHLIRQRKVFPAKFRSYLNDVQRIRDTADYRDICVSKKHASKELRTAQTFVKTIHSELLNET